jgi:hypothetical protein
MLKLQKKVAYFYVHSFLYDADDATDDAASRNSSCQISHYTTCSARQMFTSEQTNYMQESTYQ